MGKATVILGPEHDPRLQRAVMAALRELGASFTTPRWALGGSQEVVKLSAMLCGDRLLVETETYVGLALRGERAVVDRVAQLTRELYATT